MIDFLFIYVMKNEKGKEQLLINHRTVVSKCITILSGNFEKKICDNTAIQNVWWIAIPH